MGVYNNNKDGTRSTIANTIQVVDAPMEQFVSRSEFSAVVPSDTSADNKLVAENEVTKAVSTMPTASADLVGTIVQYVGETNNNFVNGKFYKCVGNSYPVIYSWKPINGDDTFVTLEMFGAVGDGITNDTSAFIQALNSGKEIHLMNKTYLIGVNITQDHTTIKGKGTIKGTLTINASYVNISDIEFQSSGSCIVLQSGKYITFDKIKTDMCKNSFYIPKPSQHQPISRVLISNSILASEYGFNCDDDEYTYYSIGDLQIVNTQFFSKIYGIRGKWIDGLVITGCTFFTQAHEAQLTDKKNNINVTGSNYVNITGCNLFEAGEESIYLSGVRGVTINGNNIVWCGQVIPSGGIVIDGLKQNVNLTSIVISNNNIQYPTDDAIVIKNISDISDANENYVISITDNTILNALGTTFYYGTDPLKDMVYVVNSSTTNPNKVLIDNNIGTGSVYPPYAMTNKQITDIIPNNTSADNKLVNDDTINDIWKVQGELGAKNLISYPYPKEFSSGTTTSGVTFTINDDGSVTLNGTATANIYKLLHTRNFGDKPFSSKYNNPNVPYLATLLNGTNNVFCNYNPNDHFTTLAINNGTTIDNLTVYPMVRYKSDTDDTWQPYAPTNYQLNQKVDTIAGVYLPNATNINSKKAVASVGQTSVTFVANSFMTRYNVTASDLDLDISAKTSSGNIVSYNNVNITGGIVTVTFDALAEQTTFICKCSVIQ